MPKRFTFAAAILVLSSCFLLVSLHQGVSKDLGHPSLRVKPTVRGKFLVGGRRGGERVVPEPRKDKFRNLRAVSMNMGKVPAAIIAIQSLGLLGATVTGFLARQRRDEIHALNDQLRKINAELRSRSDKLIEKEAVLKYIEKKDQEKSRDEADIDDSLSNEERSVDALILEAKEDISNDDVEGGIQKLKIALTKADGFDSAKFAVRGRRELSSALQRIGEQESAMDQLQRAYQLASDNVEAYPEAIHNKVALCGEIADLYADMGDFRSAAEYYDSWIAGMP